MMVRHITEEEKHSARNCDSGVLLSHSTRVFSHRGISDPPDLPMASSP